MATVDYPERTAERDAWVLTRRGPRPVRDPWVPYAFLLEPERSESGRIESVATIFLTNRECPWRCVMCDLWQNTLDETVPLGAIPRQINHALERLHELHPQGLEGSGPPAVVKLYNSGSFFDPRAIPPEDDVAIARRLGSFRHVIVECHPALVGTRTRTFRDLLRAEGDRTLEVAMGLETAHPKALAKLNKRMTLGLFREASQRLREEGIAMRVFVLVHSPFIEAAEARDWAQRTITFAFEAGASVVSLIPTRGGNGAMESLAAQGEFKRPTLADLESVAAWGVRLNRGRVMADVWDAGKFSECPQCFESRVGRLVRQNLEQEVPRDIECGACGGSRVHGKSTPARR